MSRWIYLWTLVSCSGGREQPQPDDTGVPSSGALDLGDPIRWIGSEGERGRGTSIEDLEEWVDAVVLSESVGMVVGQGGAKTVDMNSGTELQLIPQEVGYHVVSDDGLAVIATKSEGLLLLMDTSDPSQVSRSGTIDLGFIHQDIALNQDRILVGAQSEGALLLDTDGALLATLDADAYGVGLAGDRALTTDGSDLLLFDVSDTSAPIELDRVTLESNGLDISFDGEHVAVALGGHGTQVLTIEEDQLESLAVLETPGAVYSTDLAGDYLWIASGEVVALAWLSGDGPQLLGHETPAWSAMGIGAGHGVALLADWWSTTVLGLEEGVGGAEIHTSDVLYFTEVSSGSQLLNVSNGGIFTLEVEIEPQAGGFEVDPMNFSLEPGRSRNVSVRAFNENELSGSLGWHSNDPDEPTGEVRLEGSRESLGSTHDDFTLQAFQWPDDSAELITLSDYRGQVVLMSYFATFCPICNLEVPDLEASLADPFAGEDLTIWLVNSGSTQAEGWDFGGGYGIELPMLMDTDMSLYMSYSRAEASLEEYAPFPVHVILDRNGVIRYLNFRTDFMELTSTIEALLAE